MAGMTELEKNLNELLLQPLATVENNEYDAREMEERLGIIAQDVKAKAEASLGYEESALYIGQSTEDVQEHMDRLKNNPTDESMEGLVDYSKERSLGDQSKAAWWRHYTGDHMLENLAVILPIKYPDPQLRERALAAACRQAPEVLEAVHRNLPKEYARKIINLLGVGYDIELPFAEKEKSLRPYLAAERGLLLNSDDLVLGEVVTLRKELKLRYANMHSLDKIISFADLPYGFDQTNRVWWRWYSDIYGFFYHRVKRSYSVWLTTFLKRNIGTYMPLFLNMPAGKKKISSEWCRHAYLYNKSLSVNSIVSAGKPTSLDFLAVKYDRLSDAAKNLLLPGNRVHRAVNPQGHAGLETNMFVSGYNSKWHNLYKPEAQFFDCGRMPADFLTVVSNLHISSNFYINSYDSELILFPQYYLDYKNKRFEEQFKKMNDIFSVKYNANFYLNVLWLLQGALWGAAMDNFSTWKGLHLGHIIDFSVYKLNMYVWFLRYLRLFCRRGLNKNNWYVLDSFLARYKFYKINLLAGGKRLSHNNKFPALIAAVKGKSLQQRNKLYGYGYLFKLLNKFGTRDLTPSNWYWKKAYVIKWANLWEKIEGKDAEVTGRPRLFPSRYYISAYEKQGAKGFTTLVNFRKVVGYLQDVKLQRNSMALSRVKNLWSPSLIVSCKISLFQYKWLTRFGKVFVKLPEKYKGGEKKRASYYVSDFRKLKFLGYSTRFGNFMGRAKAFLAQFGLILISTLKVNFGFSYTLGVGQPLPYYSYGMQSYALMFFALMKRYFIKGGKNARISSPKKGRRYSFFDKNFFFCVNNFNKKFKKKLASKAFQSYGAYSKEYKNIISVKKL